MLFPEFTKFNKDQSLLLPSPPNTKPKFSSIFTATIGLRKSTYVFTQNQIPATTNPIHKKLIQTTATKPKEPTLKNPNQPNPSKATKPIQNITQINPSTVKEREIKWVSIWFRVLYEWVIGMGQMLTCYNKIIKYRVL